jgi:signal transduction histidine kinase
VLSDRGLLEAVEAQAGRLPLPVVIRASPTLRGARFPPAIEDAAWFGIAEGLTNALKHARADQVEVGLSRHNGLLEVEIRDHGSGFDPRGTTGFGLATLRDRMAVLGGQLNIESSPGAGARLSMRLPLPEHTDGNG